MRVIRDISRGGFGYVQEVETSDGTRVAKKSFDPQPVILAAMGRDKLMARFKREVMIQSRLPSDFFIPVLDSDLATSPAWFTMPLAVKNYTEQIREDRRAGQPAAGPLADILNSLEELHRLDYRHRDLKPQNILFHDGRWKLADFGLALPPSHDATTLTRTHEAFGTEFYMAPEQRTGFHTVLPSADIFAFGCILHDLVGTTHRTPYQQCSAPGPLGSIIEKCTINEPSRRFQSIATLRAALLHALSRGMVTAPDASTVAWEDELKDIGSWDEEKARSLLRYFQERSERSLLREIDEERLEKLANIDKETWNEIALVYCEWAGTGSFSFEYCDVIVGRLEKIFQMGAASLKAAAAVAAARLGADHNRWYVMRRLLSLCGHSLDDLVAERLSIEIIAEDVSQEFVKCVERISRTIDSYHPIIRHVLRQQVDEILSSRWRVPG